MTSQTNNSNKRKAEQQLNTHSRFAISQVPVITQLKNTYGETFWNFSIPTTTSSNPNSNNITTWNCSSCTFSTTSYRLFYKHFVERHIVLTPHPICAPDAPWSLFQPLVTQLESDRAEPPVLMSPAMPSDSILVKPALAPMKADSPRSPMERDKTICMWFNREDNTAKPTECLDLTTGPSSPSSRVASEPPPLPTQHQGHSLPPLPPTRPQRP